MPSVYIETTVISYLSARISSDLVPRINRSRLIGGTLVDTHSRCMCPNWSIKKQPPVIESKLHGAAI